MNYNGPVKKSHNRNYSKLSSFGGHVNPTEDLAITTQRAKYNTHGNVYYFLESDPEKLILSPRKSDMGRKASLK